MADEKTTPTVQEYGTLTEEQKQTILQWLGEKIKSPSGQIASCEMCGTNTWNLSTHFVTPLIFSPKGVQLGGTAYPHAMLTCVKCANSKFFNAVQIGALKKGE